MTWEIERCKRWQNRYLLSSELLRAWLIPGDSKRLFCQQNTIGIQQRANYWSSQGNKEDQKHWEIWVFSFDCPGQTKQHFNGCGLLVQDWKKCLIIYWVTYRYHFLEKALTEQRFSNLIELVWKCFRRPIASSSFCLLICYHFQSYVDFCFFFFTALSLTI